MKKQRAIAALTMACALAATTAACSSDGGDSGETFTIWWYSEPDSAQVTMWNAALEVFQEEHPEVEIVFEQKSFSQLRSNAAQILNSAEAPDIMQFNQGTGDTGFLASNGLIANLDDYAAERGWDDIIPEGGQFTGKYDEQGVMGGGSWYGVTNLAIFQTFYYNVDAFDELGLSTPTTLEELEAAMQVFVDEGTTPLSIAGGEYPGWQLWYQFSLIDADQQFVDDFILLKGTPDFQGGEMLSGAEKFASWVDAGYLTSDAASVKFDDASSAFVSGAFPIVSSGSWMFSVYQTQITGFDWDALLFPNDGLYEGSGGNNWVVPTVSDNKDLAADFIDITLRPEMQSLITENGGTAIAPDPDTATDEKTARFLEGYLDVAERFAYWPDMSVPGFDPPMVNAFQTIINGTSTPLEALATLEEPYAEGAATFDTSE